MLDFCTVEDVKALMTFASRYDNLLEDGVAATTEKFNNYIRRQLDYVADAVEVFNVPRLAYGQKHAIWLERRNITQGSMSLLLSTSRDFSEPADVTLDEANYQIDYAKGKVTIYGFIPRAMDGLRITYTGGYAAREAPNAAAMDCPPNLRSAAAEQTAFDVNRLVSSFSGSNEADKKNQPKLSTYGLLGNVADTLAPYRRLLG